MSPFGDFIRKINVHCGLVIRNADHQSATMAVRLAILWIFPRELVSQHSSAIGVSEMINPAHLGSDPLVPENLPFDMLQIWSAQSVGAHTAPHSGQIFPTEERPCLSVVVPCFNEEESIQACHVQLSESLAASGRSYEIVYVNDGSRDLTMTILREIQATDPRVQVVNLSRNFGHQVAVSAGIRYATGNAVALMDADLQDPPEVLMEMMRVLESGYDVVYGARRARAGESFTKLLTAKLFYRTLHLLSDTDIPIDTGDFRVMSRRAVDALLRMPESHRLLRGMASWIGFRQYPFYYERVPRFAGQTKYPFQKMLKLALDGVLSFSTVPLRLVSFLGVLSASVALLGIIYALCLRLFTQIWVPGWTLLFIGMLFLGGMQMLSLGVVGEYVGRIYTEAKGRPLFLVQEVLSSQGERATASRASRATA
jgi:glycosyltransferase involved in cell wall biosynthesis